MSNVIYPDRFKNLRPTQAALSQQRMLQIYTSLLNLHQSIHHGVLSHQQLNQFILQHPAGMGGSDTLVAASAVSKNQGMLEKVMECIGMIMNIMLQDAGGPPMDIIYVAANQPDDQPPTA